jgi:TolB-like protein/Tfp pilus assembly protein PilF
MIVGLFLWRPWTGSSEPQEHRSAPSIAVLPFEDLSLNRDQEYLCNGLADELISRLVNVEGLRVPARTSVFSIKGKELDIREIGEKLDVDLVLEGSLKKSGDILRITVQLVNVSDGFSLWSENYERNEEDIFRLQDDISLAIVDKLQIQLLGKEQEKLTKRPTENLEAYNLYLQGRFFLEKRTAEALRKAVDFFQSAIEKDPGYSLAYIGLADTYQMLHGYGVSSAGDVFPKAKIAILKALEIDENLSEAHTSLGWIKFFFEWDWPGAETSFRRALELNPDSAQGYHWLGWYLGAMGRYEEALSAFERSRELDPLSLIINSASIWCYNVSGQTDKATEQYHKTIELDENYPRAHFWYGLTLLQMNEIEKALEQFETAVEISGGNPQYLSALAYAYALAERKEEAEELLGSLQRLYRESYVSPVQMARVYIGLNDMDRAFEWLERAYEESAGWLCLIKVEQIYNPLRTDQRFQALLKKMDLE